MNLRLRTTRELNSRRGMLVEAWGQWVPLREVLARALIITISMWQRRAEVHCEYLLDMSLVDDSGVS